MRNMETIPLFHVLKMIIILQECCGFLDPLIQRERTQCAIGGFITADIKIIHRNIHRAAFLPDNLRLCPDYPVNGIQNFPDAGTVPTAKVEDPMGGTAADNVENPADGIVNVKEIPNHTAVTVDGDRLMGKRSRRRERRWGADRDRRGLQDGRCGSQSRTYGDRDREVSQS